MSGVDPDDPTHGTSRGYKTHRRMGERACGPCLAGHSRYNSEGKHRWKRPKTKTIKSQQQKKRHKWKRKGLDPWAAQRALEEHLGYCELCGTTEPGAHGWHVDHNHNLAPVAPVRGILCGLCNAGLGMFRDDPRLLHQAIQYLGRG